jgi:hypothetical protein
MNPNATKQECENNIEYRMMNDRGYTKEKWNNVIEGMREIFEPITDDEVFDEYLTEF